MKRLRRSLNRAGSPVSTRRRLGERDVSLRESQVAGRFGVASRASSESREVSFRGWTVGSQATRTG